MKKVPAEIVKELKSLYEPNWVEAMLQPEVSDKILSFLEESTDVYKFSYQQVFFAPNGFNIYEKDGERRIFCAKSESFGENPLNEEFAKGDWQSWLKDAKLVNSLKWK